MGFIEIEWGSMDWIGGAEDRDRGQGQVVGSCEHGDEPLGSIKCREFLD
jgi:hypothetical protein